MKLEGDAESSSSDTEKLPPPKVMSTIPKSLTTARRTSGKTIWSETLELYMMLKFISFGLASLSSSQSK